MPYSQGSQNHSVARLFIYRDGVPVAVAPSGYRSDAEQIEDIAELVRRANAFDLLLPVLQNLVEAASEPNADAHDGHLKVVLETAKDAIKRARAGLP